MTASPQWLILDDMHTSRSQPRGYRGSKAGSGVTQTLINLMPPHRTYIEPFVGHGAVLLAKRPAALTIGLDLDPAPIQRVRACLQHRQGASDCSPSDSGESACLAHRHCGDVCSASDSDDAAGQLITSDDVAGCPTLSDDAAGAVITIGTARYLVQVGDGLRFLASYAFRGDELVYCDPPYVRSARRARGRLYLYEMDDQQHVALLTLLRRLPCAVMLSGYPSALYADYLSDWRTITFQAQTRGGPATEMVWMNFAAPTALHDYTHLGQDFRAREKPRRLQKRWLTKLVAKPPLEQQALLLAQLEGVESAVAAAVVRAVLAQDGAPAAAHTRASRCTVCRHPDRPRIDQALLAGVAVREVAQRAGLSKSVVGRHRAHGLDAAVSHFATGTVPPRSSPPQALRSVQLPLF